MEYKIKKWHWILKIIRNNEIGVIGSSKLGKGISKLMNLTTYNLDIG